MDLGLAGKTAIVTGGSRGLGASICEAFAAEGASSVVDYVSDEASAARLVERLERSYGTNATAFRADVRKAEDVELLIRHAIDTFGGFDILVNNAGTWPLTALREIADEEWEETLRANLTSSFLTCKRAVNYFIEEGRSGKIVNIVSINAFQGSSGGHAHYAAAKGGLLAFTYSLAREVAKHGITVNAVCPGMMRTDMNREVLANREEEYLARIPLGRISEPAEVASSVVFLVSKQAGYITGSTINVSGGMLMQ